MKYGEFITKWLEAIRSVEDMESRRKLVEIYDEVKRQYYLPNENSKEQIAQPLLEYYSLFRAYNQFKNTKDYLFQNKLDELDESRFDELNKLFISLQSPAITVNSSIPQRPSSQYTTAGVIAAIGFAPTPISSVNANPVLRSPQGEFESPEKVKPLRDNVSSLDLTGSQFHDKMKEMLCNEKFIESLEKKRYPAGKSVKIDGKKTKRISDTLAQIINLLSRDITDDPDSVAQAKTKINNMNKIYDKVREWLQDRGPELKIKGLHETSNPSEISKALIDQGIGKRGSQPKEEHYIYAVIYHCLQPIVNNQFGWRPTTSELKGKFVKLLGKEERKEYVFDGDEPAYGSPVDTPSFRRR